MGTAWLEGLYDAHGEALYGFVLNLTRSPGEAEEVVQELFLKAAKDRGRFAGLGALDNPRSYLLRTAHRLVIDRLRRRRAEERAGEASESGEEGVFVPVPGEAEDARFFRRKIEAALSALPVEQRAVVHLKIWEEKTFEEIAALLDIPLNTAASRYRYGLEKLKGALRPVEGEWNGSL